MKVLKEVLRALKNSYIILLSVILLQVLPSCAHTFDHKTVSSYQGTIEQVLRVRIKNKDSKEKLTVYASINREKRQAIFDGVGKFDKHVFTLEVKNGSYFFKDHMNDKEESGKIKDFDIIPLDEETLFVKLDKNSPQPIKLEEPSKELYVEIWVVDQQEPK